LSIISGSLSIALFVSNKVIVGNNVKVDQRYLPEESIRENMSTHCISLSEDLSILTGRIKMHKGYIHIAISITNYIFPSLHVKGKLDTTCNTACTHDLRVIESVVVGLYLLPMTRWWLLMAALSSGAPTWTHLIMVLSTAW